jgi:hypothetical protein
LFDPAATASNFHTDISEEIMLNRLPLFIAAVLCLSWFAAPANMAFADQTREDNIDRPGGDFRNFPVNPPPPGSFGTVVDGQLRTGRQLQGMDAGEGWPSGTASKVLAQERHSRGQFQRLLHQRRSHEGDRAKHRQAGRRLQEFRSGCRKSQPLQGRMRRGWAMPGLDLCQARRSGTKGKMLAEVFRPAGVHE